MFYLPDRGVLSGCCLSIRDRTSLGKFKEGDLKENFPPEILYKRICINKYPEVKRGPKIYLKKVFSGFNRNYQATDARNTI